ncbi:DUF4118 domain-containing protein, partial [Escherichia coli]|nr:DUF4118 domain-containing protein [Escherichia coli]
SALYGGLGPGLLASLLGAVGATFFLLPPAYAFAVALPADLLRLFLFSATATLVSYLVAARRRAEEAARARSEMVRFQAELL